jgi:Rrf2 family protein
MLSSSRFLVAVHVLSMLAHKSGSGPVCSSVIATSVNTNPVVIRRLMSQLEKANLVTSVAGRAGGFLLNRKACDMTLADIYSAVEDDTVFRMHKIGPDNDCPFAAQLGKILEPRLKSAERAMTASLDSTKLSDVALAIN